MLHREYVLDVLNKYFPYCRNISPFAMEKFCDRVIYFESRKQFIPRGDIERVSDEIKVIICSHAAWLLRGLPQTQLEFFNRIDIYEDEFYSYSSESYQTGEMDPEGTLVFAWKSVARNCLKAGDGKNVAFNIFAHTLSFQSRNESQQIDIFDQDLLQAWGIAADQEYERIKSGKSTYFPVDRVGDRKDFFALCVELLFEQPEEFWQHHPDLFTKLTRLLNLETESLKYKINLS